MSKTESEIFALHYIYAQHDKSWIAKNDDEQVRLFYI
jgi:hypothetical protein